MSQGFLSSVHQTRDSFATSREFRHRFDGSTTMLKRLARPQKEIERARALRVWRRVREGTITGAALEGVRRDYAEWFRLFEAEEFTAKSSKKEAA